MATWNSRGLRGSTLEDLINKTNEKYREHKLCLIQKVPTPITPINIDKSSRHITLAYFDQKSTVDYIGVAQGIPLCFDAKECAVDTFTLANIHEHQVEFMREFEEQDGIAFFLIYYSHRDYFYYLRFNKLLEFWDRMRNGGRKSFRFEETEEDYQIKPKPGILVPYLDLVNRDLKERQAVLDKKDR
ncbi:MAG: Holliday junction resolvase RecU [Lachnospiraceae bacterium]|nr:Holliday junction resolvase RecU [Lachnospiraceae bacterium]